MQQEAAGSGHTSVCEVLCGDCNGAVGSCVEKQAGAVGKDKDHSKLRYHFPGPFYLTAPFVSLNSSGRKKPHSPKRAGTFAHF